MTTTATRAVLALLAALFAALFTGCAGYLENYESTTINEQQFPVEKNSSAECIKAAKRATSFCVGRKSMMDVDSHASCNDARWDYHRYCN